MKKKVNGRQDLFSSYQTVLLIYIFHLTFSCR